MLKSENISFAYNGQEVLTFPDVICRANEHWLLLGLSGSGKTTLLHLLAGLRTPKTGTVTVGDVIMSQLRGTALDKFRGKHIGLVFQQPHFVRSITVEENLALTQSLSGNSVDKSKIRALLERLRLEHKRNSSPASLSQGEQQRVAIARAIINDPVVILADEPTSALDDSNTTEVLNLLEEQADKAGATLLIVTHDTRLKDRFTNKIEL